MCKDVYLKNLTFEYEYIFHYIISINITIFNYLSGVNLHKSHCLLIYPFQTFKHCACQLVVLQLNLLPCPVFIVDNVMNKRTRRVRHSWPAPGVDTEYPGAHWASLSAPSPGR